MYSEADGVIAAAGQALAYPSLSCTDASQPCIYQPAPPAPATGCATVTNGSMDAYFLTAVPSNPMVHTMGGNYAYTDGHVKWMRHSGDYRYDPYANYTGNMTSTVITDGCHAWLFRPEMDLVQ